MKPHRRAALLLVPVLSLSCASTRAPLYLDRQANFGAVRRVAVLPFENFSNDVHAAEKVRQILSIELLAAHAFEVVDSGDVAIAMAQAKIERPSLMSPEQVKLLGEKLGVEAVLLGTVHEMSVDRSSGAASPSVSLQFRLVDAASNATIWSTVVSRQGASVATKLFGVGGKSTNEVIEDLVREALSSLIR